MSDSIVCPKCGFERAAPAGCPSCGATFRYTRPFEASRTPIASPVRSREIRLDQEEGLRARDAQPRGGIAVVAPAHAPPPSPAWAKNAEPLKKVENVPEPAWFLRPVPPPAAPKPPSPQMPVPPPTPAPNSTPTQLSRPPSPPPAATEPDGRTHTPTFGQPASAGRSNTLAFGRPTLPPTPPRRLPPTSTASSTPPVSSASIGPAPSVPLRPAMGMAPSAAPTRQEMPAVSPIAPRDPSRTTAPATPAPEPLPTPAPMIDIDFEQTPTPSAAPAAPLIAVPTPQPALGTPAIVRPVVAPSSAPPPALLPVPIHQATLECGAQDAASPPRPAVVEKSEAKAAATPDHKLERNLERAVETVEEIHATPAGLFSRNVARIIDLVCLAALMALTLSLAEIATGESLMSLPRLRLFALPLCGFLGALTFAYAALFHALGNGRTPGKWVAGIYLLDATGQPPSLIRSAVRALCAFASAALLFLGFAAALFSRRRQAFHDKLTGTYVVRLLDASRRRQPSPRAQTSNASRA